MDVIFYITVSDGERLGLFWKPSFIHITSTVFFGKMSLSRLPKAEIHISLSSLRSYFNG